MLTNTFESVNPDTANVRIEGVVGLLACGWQCLLPNNTNGWWLKMLLKRRNSKEERRQTVKAHAQPVEKEKKDLSEYLGSHSRPRSRPHKISWHNEDTGGFLAPIGLLWGKSWWLGIATITRSSWRRRLGSDAGVQLQRTF